MVVGARSTRIAPDVSCFHDTCNVYVLRSGREAVLVDFGSGDVLDNLDELGVDRVTDVLVTHFHRDQVQGLERAVAAGARIWVPPAERDFFDGANERWLRRQLVNDYDLREDRFALLASIPVTGTVDEYRRRRYGAFELYTLPTPGHTLGSETYLVEVDGRRLAFTGDLIHGEGTVWSLAATQWTYSGVEGWAATIISTHLLAELDPAVLLPSHGEPIEMPRPALTQLADRMQELIDLRLDTEWNVRERIDEPFAPVLPHLLRNRTVFANSYVLLSESGNALLIDFGYDVTTTASSTEREARRALLWSLEALKRRHGVDRIEVAIPTHFHDDHVAGLNLVREVEGTEVWVPANVAPILAEPLRYDLPCIWFDPISADRVLEVGNTVRWHEYELTVHALPGHTRFAVALEVEVDGKRVLATGDQQADTSTGPVANYQYRNRFEPEDFVRSAELYRRLRPDVIISGHWLPREVDDAYVEKLLRDAQRLVELHDDLLSKDGFGPDGFGARIEPYRVRHEGPVEFDVIVRNPFDREETAVVRLTVPPGWSVEPEVRELALAAKAEDVVTFKVVPTGPGRLAADLTVGETRFGEQAEAVVEAP